MLFTGVLETECPEEASIESRVAGTGIPLGLVAARNAMKRTLILPLRGAYVRGKERTIGVNGLFGYCVGSRRSRTSSVLVVRVLQQH